MAHEMMNCGTPIQCPLAKVFTLAYSYQPPCLRPISSATSLTSTSDDS